MRYIFCLSFFSFYIITSQAQWDHDYCGLFRSTIDVYNENAISPIDIDRFDEKEFEIQILKILDPDYIIFDSSINSLFDTVSKIMRKDLKDSYCGARKNLARNYKNNLKATLIQLEKLKNDKVDFDIKDSVYISPFFKEEIYSSEKGKRCLNMVKSMIITDVFMTPGNYDSLVIEPAKLKVTIESEKIKIIDKQINQIKNKLENPDILEADLYYAFTNSLLTQFDKYAFAFSKESFSDFQELLSTYSESYGLYIEYDKEGTLRISSILPGCYAWKTGLLNAGDAIIKVKTNNDPPLSTNGTKYEELIDYLTRKQEGILTITVKKPDNQIREVTLHRENIEDLEKSVQVFVLNGEIKVGYVNLPAFYTSWEKEKAFGCSQDVGRAIYLLMKEGIEALMVDLRNNSGGSLAEAIDLAGIFIDFGTLSVSRNRNNELISLKDLNRGALYNGPLALLVNKSSASASEMVAAVLQDYNRAIVIGDTTFGKAVGQALMPVEAVTKNLIKLTTESFFRVNGKTYNNKGVIPDIYLPDMELTYPIGRKLPENLSTDDSINKKIFYTPLKPIPIDDLRRMSKSRVSENEKFRLILELDSTLARMPVNKGYLPLDYKSYSSMIVQAEAIERRFSLITGKASGIYRVEMLQKENDLKKKYKYYSDLFDQFAKSVEADPFIEETYKILIDYTVIK